MSNHSAEFSIAPFRFDITPPISHPLLGGLIMPAIAIDDRLEALGYVLCSADAPIVVCVLDWAGLLNDAHHAWCATLAEAAGTSVDRVAVHCVHQHNAPFVCPEANTAAIQAGLPPMYDAAFFSDCLDRARIAVHEALRGSRPLTHVAHGMATVRQVASNRRVARDHAGRVLAMRSSTCGDPELRALREGTIDPQLQTVAYFSGGKKVLACHYYATHPMSCYRDGRISSDFCGLARKRRQMEEPDCAHLYFTGCAGNVAAGKYNDGSPATREILTQRIYDGIVASEARLVPEPLETVAWRSCPVLPRPLAIPVGAPAGSESVTTAPSPSTEGFLAAFRTGWLRRVERGVPLTLSRLGLNDIAILHLPGEMFVEYQLRARAMRPGLPVLVAAYGDDGPWYVPTKEEYSAGGYEVSVAFCAENVDDLFTNAIRRLLS